jgi:hypothetical protein
MSVSLKLAGLAVERTIAVEFVGNDARAISELG